MKTLTIVANITAKAEKLDLVKSELLKLVGTSRTEEGCLHYSLHQDNENPLHFMVYENWESAEFLQAHVANQPFQDYGAATDGAVEEFTINQMSVIA